MENASNGETMSLRKRPYSKKERCSILPCLFIMEPILKDKLINGADL